MSAQAIQRALINNGKNTSEVVDPARRLVLRRVLESFNDELERLTSRLENEQQEACG